MAAPVGLTGLTVDDVCSWLASRGTTKEDLDKIRGTYTYMRRIACQFCPVKMNVFWVHMGY